MTAVCVRMSEFGSTIEPTTEQTVMSKAALTFAALQCGHFALPGFPNEKRLEGPDDVEADEDPNTLEDEIVLLLSVLSNVDVVEGVGVPKTALPKIEADLVSTLLDVGKLNGEPLVGCALVSINGLNPPPPPKANGDEAVLSAFAGGVEKENDAETTGGTSIFS